MLGAVGLVPRESKRTYLEAGGVHFEPSNIDQPTSPSITWTETYPFRSSNGAVMIYHLPMSFEQLSFLAADLQGLGVTLVIMPLHVITSAVTCSPVFFSSSMIAASRLFK